MTYISQANLDQQIAVQLPTNGVGEITAAALRGVLDTMATATYQPNIFTLATTAILLNYFPAGTLPDATQASTSGYSTEGDGGGALFYYNASDTTTPDNGGTIRVDAQNRRWFAANQIAVVPELFGAVPDGVTDSTTALTAWLTYLNGTSKNTFGQLSAGIYLTSATLDFGGVTIQGVGNNWQGNQGSVIRANLANILVAKNGYQLSNFAIDGFGIALWGWMTSNVRTLSINLAVVRCTEYGVVTNAQQNSCHINLNCRFNTYGLVLANGTRNTNFLSYTSSIEQWGGVTTPSSAARCILFLIDTSNPHGFGLDGGVTTGGNDRINFYGGISEGPFAGALADYVIESQNLSGFGGVTAGLIVFDSYEFDGAVLGTFKFDSTWVGNMVFRSGYIGIGDGTVPMVSGAYGRMTFDSNVKFNGAQNFAQYGIVNSTNLYRAAWNYYLSDDINPSWYLEGVVGTVTYTAASRSFAVTNGPQGVGGIGGVALSGNTAPNSQTALFIAAVKPIMKITFSVSSVVGGGGSIKVYAGIAGAPFRTLIGTYGTGTHEVLYQTLGTEAGPVSFTYYDVTSFVVSGVSIEFQ